MKLHLNFYSMTQKMTIWGTVNTVMGIVNLVLFILWLSIIKLESYKPSSDKEYFYEALSLQITVLDIIVVFVTIILTIAGIVGYNSLKTSAEAKATEVAEKIASSEMLKFKEEQNKNPAADYSPATSTRESNATPTGVLHEKSVIDLSFFLMVNIRKIYRFKA